MTFVELEGLPALFLMSGVIGLFFTFVGTVVAVRQWRFVTAATRALGKVVAIEEVEGETTDDEGHPARTLSYHPVVAYVDMYGVRRRVKTKTGSYPAAAAVGDKVTVLYDRNYPELMDIESAFQIWVVPAVLLALGLLVLGFTVAGIFHSRA